MARSKVLMFSSSGTAEFGFWLPRPTSIRNRIICGDQKGVRPPNGSLGLRQPRPPAGGLTETAYDIAPRCGGATVKVIAVLRSGEGCRHTPPVSSANGGLRFVNPPYALTNERR